MLSLVIPLVLFFLCLRFLLGLFFDWRVFEQDQSPMDDQKEASPTIPFTQLGQVNKDFALARTLQEQEWAFMMLRMNDGDDEEHTSDDDDDGGDDDDSEFLVDDEVDDDEFFMTFEEEAGEQDLETEQSEEEDSNDQELEQDVDPDELSYEELDALGELIGTQNRGLSMDAVASLPSFTYEHQPSFDESFNRCVICQVDYEEGEALVVLPCKHPYHSECINKWLQINKVCPVCSVEVSSSSLGKTT